MIPDSVTRIENDVFNSCEKLSEVYCLSSTPPTVQKTGGYIFLWDAFKGCNSELQIYVPIESVDAYKAADGWSEYADAIVGFEPQPANNEIWYTSTDGNIVEPYSEGVDVFGANIVSNTYENGKGVIKFDGDVTKVGRCHEPVGVQPGYYPIISTVPTIKESKEAFTGCTTLQSITLPQSVTDATSMAFADCSNLKQFNGKFSSEDGKSLIVEDQLVSVATASCVGKYVVPTEVKEILSLCFMHCNEMTEIEFHDEMTEIYPLAFFDCNGLTAVELPKQLSCISPFYECSSLKTFTLNSANYGILYENAYVENLIINDGVTSIEPCAFSQCYQLKNIVIPDSIEEIGYWAFMGCDGIQEFVIPQGVSIIEEQTFYGCRNLTKVIIPDSVTEIQREAFFNCQSLTSFTIPENITTLGENIFGWCSNLSKFEGKFASEDGRCLIVDGILNSFAPAGLTEYTIPEGVTQIGTGVFSLCKNLTSITIPAGVVAIGHSAFSGCVGLEEVYCTPITPPTVGIDVFVYTDTGNIIRNLDCTIYVPAESVDAYKASVDWKKYENNIVGWDQITITPLEVTSTDSVSFNVKCLTKDAAKIYYVANTEEEWLAENLTTKDLLDEYGWRLENLQLNAANSDEGCILTFGDITEGDKLYCAIKVVHASGLTYYSDIAIAQVPTAL